MVHDGIDESIREVIGFHVPSITCPLAQALPHRVENIAAGFLLNRNDILSPQDDADLFKNNIVIFRLIDHLQNDKELVIVLFDLWSLPSAEYILERQRMDTKMISELF